MALIKTYETNTLYRIHGRLELRGFDAGDGGLGLAKRRERECRPWYRMTCFFKRIDSLTIKLGFFVTGLLKEKKHEAGV